MAGVGQAKHKYRNVLFQKKRSFGQEIFISVFCTKLKIKTTFPRSRNVKIFFSQMQESEIVYRGTLDVAFRETEKKFGLLTLLTSLAFAFSSTILLG